VKSPDEDAENQDEFDEVSICYSFVEGSGLVPENSFSFIGLNQSMVLAKPNLFQIGNARLEEGEWAFLF